MVIGIWGQSNAVRESAGRTFDSSEDSPGVSYSLGKGRTNVIRWNGKGDFDYVRSGIVDGSITEKDKNEDRAYVDLANRLYERMGLCVIYVSSAVGGSGLQPDTYPDAPGMVWYPEQGELFGPALEKLEEAYAAIKQARPAREHPVLIYWNQGIRDAKTAYEQWVLHQEGGPEPTVTLAGWKDSFLKLAEETRSRFDQSFPGSDLRILLSLSATDRAHPNNPFARGLQAAQREATLELDFIHLTSEVMPDTTTYPNYVDCLHLSWKQHRYCENAAIADGITQLLEEGGRHWTPLHLTCEQPPPAVQLACS